MRRLQTRVRRLGISDKVTFTGAVFGEESKSCFVARPSCANRADMKPLVCPCSKHCCGGARAHHARGKFPEVQTSGAGVICKGQSRELAQNMLMLLQQSELRETMGKRGVL